MPVSFGRTTLGVLGLVISPIAYAAVGAVLASQIPRNPIGWIFLGVAVAVGVMLPVNLLVASIHESLRQAPTLVIWIAWFRTAFGSPVMIPLLVLAGLLFPDGRPINRRWFGAIGLTVAAGGLLVFATAVDPQGLWSYPTLPNPAAVPNGLAPTVTAIRYAAVGLLVPGIALAVAAVWLRYRRGSMRLRAQLRWILLGVVISAICALPYLAARFVLEVDESTGEMAAAIAQAGSIAFPIAAVFAISRYRLFDIDLLIGRTLVYVPLMAILSGLYSAGIALFQRAFVALTGETSDAAIVLTVLLVATAFTPLRKALEAFADRRFPAHHRDTAPAEPAPPVAAPGSGEASAGTNAHLLPLDSAGVLSCPLGGAKNVYDCLTCPYFRSTIGQPRPAVVCQPPPSLVP
jgi:hypothetical protein